jgi:preprotein translocase subunit SecD
MRDRTLLNLDSKPSLMANLRSLLLIALALGMISNLLACGTQKGSETLPSTTRDASQQTNKKLRHSDVQLSFSEQKPGTEAQLPLKEQVRQDLLQKKTQLKKSGLQTAIAANEAALKSNGWEIASLFKKPILTEKNIVDAFVDTNANPKMFSIGVKFDAEGSSTFAALTKKLAGTGRSIGIFLDGHLISYPTIPSQYVQTGITGGNAVISGNFSEQQANNLASLLRGESPKTISK